MTTLLLANQLKLNNYLYSWYFHAYYYYLIPEIEWIFYLQLTYEKNEAWRNWLAKNQSIINNTLAIRIQFFDP